MTELCTHKYVCVISIGEAKMTVQANADTNTEHNIIPLKKLTVKSRRLALLTVVISCLTFALMLDKFRTGQRLMWESSSKNLNSTRKGLDTKDFPVNEKSLKKYGTIVAQSHSPASLYRSVLTISPRWAMLDKNNPSLYVYAAHFDDSDSVPVVVVILTGPSRVKSFPVVCLYFDGPDVLRPMSMVHGTCQNYTDFTRFARGIYHGGFVKCPLSPSNHRPYAVSVFRENSTLPRALKSYNALMTNLMVIHYSGRLDTRTKHSRVASTYQWNLTKCFPALFNYHGLAELVQQIEVHRLFGVEHFTLYKFSSSPDVDMLLQYYMKQGLVDVYNWTLPKPVMFSNETKRGLFNYFNQMDAIQDCLLRHLRSSRYLLFGDIDEFFVPRSGSDLQSLLNRHFTLNPRCGGFLFRNTFFDPLIKVGGGDTASDEDGDSDDDGDADAKYTGWKFAEKHGLRTLLLVHRVNEIWKVPKRSKPVVIPSRVNVTGIHDIKSFRGHYTQCTLSPSEALLHHYRRVPGFIRNRHNAKRAGYRLDLHLRGLSANIVRRVRKVFAEFRSSFRRDEDG